MATIFSWSQYVKQVRIYAHCIWLEYRVMPLHWALYYNNGVHAINLLSSHHILRKIHVGSIITLECHCWVYIYKKLEQLEHLQSEDTPASSWLLVPYYWVILDPKSNEDKVKVTNLTNLPKLKISAIWHKLYMQQTFWSCLIRCGNI